MNEVGLDASPVAALPLPRMHGRRVLLKLAARGGMGDVYLAATTGLEGAERPCIVKTVRRDHMHDGSFLARFLDEARVQSQLQHPGVAQVLEAAADEGGEPYTAVEYVEGRPLSEVRQRAIQLGTRIPWADAVAIAIEVAQALAHVHDRASADGSPLGIVHRDLSPQNVMVGYAGEVKLIDFGTARGHNRRCRTVAGVVFAKPGYVAPEVAREQVGDGRIDLYALGIMLWELCAGRRFLSGDPQKHLDDAAGGRIVVPQVAEACRAPAALDEVIANLTKNDPDERFPRATAAVAALAKVLSSAPTVEGHERGVRARIARVMHALWPKEPARSRNEFARLLREAREQLREPARETPTAGAVSEVIATRMTPADPAQLAGTPYRLGRKLGEGASGAVYEAEHVELGRKLAIKVLRPEHAASSVALERFRREARSAANLSHANVVQLYDFGRSLDGHAFLAMELCSGSTLDARLRDRPLAWREAVRIAIEVASALEVAHAAGLVHRDLKPQNLMLVAPSVSSQTETASVSSQTDRSSVSSQTDRRSSATPAVKLLDFGVATALAAGDKKPESERERARRGFAIFGTPEYMAPEQVAGDPVDGRADLYALGCVLYEMLTGEAAFDGPSSVVVMGKQVNETPLPPRARAPRRDIPRSVEAVVMRAMQKVPAARFSSAREMRDALVAALCAPERKRTYARRLGGALLTATAMVVAAIGSARWARAHAAPVETAAIASTPPPPLPASTAAVTTAPPPASSAPGNVPPALREARAAVHAHPSSPHALEAWAVAALRAGELREANRAASAWALHDGTLGPRLLMADVLDASGRRPEAMALLSEWLETHPDADDARAWLSRVEVAHR